MIVNFSLLLIVFLQTCLSNTTLPNEASEEYVPRVVNGKPAILGDVPYQVALKSKVSRNQYATFCGATIIGPTKLLSAAHCFHKDECSNIFRPGRASKSWLKGKFAVAGNLWNRAIYKWADSADGQWRKLHSAYYPKNYKFPKHDIAVLYLKTKFIYNAYIGPIPTATKDIDYVGKCLVSGYGRTGSGKYGATSDKLLLAHLDVLSKWKCTQMHRKRMDKFVCTSSMITDVGKGDSGGPLVCAGSSDPNDKGKGVLVGVVSGHAVNVGSFFTRVSSYQSILNKRSISIHAFQHQIARFVTILFVSVIPITIHKAFLLL